MEGKMNITIKDIAEKCGVSKGTVDRALNNRSGVNEKTKAFILKTAEEMGYHPHYLATSLVTGKTKSIGVVVFDLHNTFFAQLLDAISNKAKEYDYFVYITLTDKNPSQEIECIEHLVNGRVDGLIVCPINFGLEYETYLKGIGVPVVSVMNKLDDPFFAHSDINTYQAMHDATRYVISKGYERIIYFSPPLAHEGKTNITSQKQRLLGHLAAMEQVTSSVESIIIPRKNYEEVFRAVNERNGKKTAVICSSDVFALQVMAQLKLRGIRIPYDVGIMGFDAIADISYIQPSLTTVSIPIKEVGEQAVVQLIHQLTDTDARARTMYSDYSIIAGQTII